jgi:hypothetical protein
VITLRASAIGGCLRALVYQGLQVKGEPRNRDSRLTLALGQVMEPVILDILKYKVEDPQIELTLPINSRIQIVGHPEGREKTTLLEVKTMAAWAWGQAKKQSVITYYPQYAMQNAVYFAGFGGLVDRSEFILFNKNTSKIIRQKFSYFDLAPFILQSVKVARQVDRFINWGIIPEKPENLKKWQCQAKYCQYHHCEHNEGHQKFMEKRAA